MKLKPDQPECNHLVGFARVTVTNSLTEQLLGTWLNEMRADTYRHTLGPLSEGSYQFKFCPDCGRNITDLPHSVFEASAITADPTNNGND